MGGDLQWEVLGQGVRDVPGGHVCVASSLYSFRFHHLSVFERVHRGLVQSMSCRLPFSIRFIELLMVTNGLPWSSARSPTPAARQHGRTLVRLRSRRHGSRLSLHACT